MTEFRTAGGWLLLTDRAVEIHRGGATVVVPLDQLDDIDVTTEFVHVRRAGAPTATAADLPRDPTMISLAPEQAPAAAVFRDTALAARPTPANPQPAPVDDTLSLPAAPRPVYGPPSRERPDIKAAMYWFRQLVDLPTADRWLIETVGQDELVLGAFDVFRTKAEGWRPLLVTDRRLIYATDAPEPHVFELPLAALIRVEQSETNDSGHVRIRLLDRTGSYYLWVSRMNTYHRFYLTVNNARTFGVYAKPADPEPNRGDEVAKQYTEYTQLRAQMDAGTVPEEQVGERVAAIFGVQPQ